MGDKAFQKVEKEKSSFKKVKSAKERNLYVGKVACPECNSMETSANNPGTYIIAAGLLVFVSSLIAFSCSLWVPIIGWALLIPFGFGMVLGLAILGIGTVLTALIRTLTFKCSSCGAVHKIKTKEYKKMAKETTIKII